MWGGVKPMLSSCLAQGACASAALPSVPQGEAYVGILHGDGPPLVVKLVN